MMDTMLQSYVQSGGQNVIETIANVGESENTVPDDEEEEEIHEE
jgi:hypothetical protein